MVALQPLKLQRCLYPFGDAAQAQGARQGQHRGGDGFVIRVKPQAIHKTFVNLEFPQGHPLEVGQRRVARAKVVNGNGHVSRLDGLQGLQNLSRIVEQAALGDFDLHGAGRHPQGPNLPRQLLGKPRVTQRTRRHVERNFGQAQARLLPLRQLLEQHVLDQPIHLHNQPTGLGHRDEL